MAENEGPPATPAPAPTPAPGPAPTPGKANPVFENALGPVVIGLMSLLVAILLVYLVLAFFDIFGVEGEVVPGSESSEPVEDELYSIWSLFVWLVISGGVLTLIVSGLSAIATVAIKVIARNTTSSTLAYYIIVTCLIGVVASVLLMWQLSSQPDLGWLRTPTEFSDAEFTNQLYAFLGIIATWLLGFVARQVGVTETWDLAKELFKKWTGQ